MTHHVHDKPIRAAVFTAVDRAESAIQRLLEEGFNKEHISVLCSDQAKKKHFREFENEEPADKHLKQAVVSGSTIGAVFGGLTSAGLVTTAGLSILVAGPSFLIGGAVAGGLIGAMMTRGEEGELADLYDQALSRGDLLVAVEDHSDHMQERLALAEEVFEEAGAEPFQLEEE